MIGRATSRNRCWLSAIPFGERITRQQAKLYEIDDQPMDGAARQAGAATQLPHRQRGLRRREGPQERNGSG
jgi:hypothetical protein